MIKVELDVHSDKPNPKWQLAPGDEAQLHGLIAAAPRSTVTDIENDGGYRGFVARLSDEEILRVRRGIIEIARGAQRTYRIDGDRAVERWLLATGRPTLASSDYQTAVAALWD